MDISTLDTNASPAETIANILQDDFSIEVIPASTLSSVLGSTVPESGEIHQTDCVLKEGKASTADFVYIWNSADQYFKPYSLRILVLLYIRSDGMTDLLNGMESKMMLLFILTKVSSLDGVLTLRLLFKLMGLQVILHKNFVCLPLISKL